MTTFEYSGWLVEHDPEATRKAYEGQTTGHSERHDCTECRNFVAARDQAFPPETRWLFQELGIDFRKEAEAVQMGEIETGRLRYEGWFQLVGRVLKDPETMTAIGPTLGIWFWPGNPEGESWKGLEVLWMNFEVFVPWVLDEPQGDGYQ